MKNNNTIATTEITIEDKKNQLKKLEKTREQIENIKFAKQRSQEWKESRYNVITASIAGHLAGHTTKAKKEKALLQLLWPEWGREKNKAMESGTAKEGNAFTLCELELKEKYEKLGYKHVWLEETGLLISYDHPFMGASSDGLFYAKGHSSLPDFCATIEIKCPFKSSPYPVTPREYYDQFQMTAAIVGVQHIYFVVHTSEITEISEYSFNELYWKNDLLPTLTKVYHDEYLWRWILKDRGLIEPGSLEPKLIIPYRPVKKIKETIKGEIDDDEEIQEQE